MRIFDDEPADWRALQDRVAQVFSEIGCDARVAETVTLVRGKKEIDVFVRDPGTTPVSLYFCECKLWSAPVPKEVIHSFRQVYDFIDREKDLALRNFQLLYGEIEA